MTAVSAKRLWSIYPSLALFLESTWVGESLSRSPDVSVIAHDLDVGKFELELGAEVKAIMLPGAQRSGGHVAWTEDTCEYGDQGSMSSGVLTAVFEPIYPLRFPPFEVSAFSFDALIIKARLEIANF